MIGIIIGSIGVIFSIINFIYIRINYHWSGYDKDLNCFIIPVFILNLLLIIISCFN